MSDNLKLLKDIFVVRAQKDLCDLSAEDKTKFCDQAMSGPTEHRGITVTFNLSSSARRINNRIYTPRGQRAGLTTWTKPYGKPILLHHDRMKDPVGRIVSVDYVENDQEAMRFFRSIQDFANFKAAVESDDPKAIFKSLMDNNLVGNPEWPGLGHLRARARITDRDAIQKFLDERYLTFSAGSHSDRYVCSICNEDWAKGDMCEHMPGKITDEGMPTVFITGTFYGDEASVVNEPANNLSTVHSIEFSDSVSTDRFDPQSLRIDPTTIYYVDSIISTGESMEHQDSTETDTSGNEQQEDVLAKVMKALEDAKKEILTQVLEKIQAAQTQTQTQVDQQVEDEDKPVEDETIDWYLLDVALDAELGDAKLSSEKREALSAKSFCGPGRSFPVPDCAHVTAARRLIGRAKLSADQKDRVLACVARKAKNMGCDSSEQTTTTDTTDTVETVCASCEALQKDYESALLRIEALQQDLENLKNSQTALDTQTDTSQNENSDSSSAELPARVENPSIAGHGAGTQVAAAKLGDYEKNIVNRYLDIKKNQGQAAADLYLGRKKAARHVPMNFNITNFIQESD
jgi:hypothetical protein